MTIRERYDREIRLAEEHALKAAEIIVEHPEHFGYKGSLYYEWAETQIRDSKKKSND
jgi:hypothetical protein